MINLYYTPSSGSLSSSILIIPDNTNISQSSYRDITLDITSSQYKVSGSSNFLNYTRVYIKSGSTTYASFPVDETNIYYLTPYEYIYYPDPNKIITSSASDVFVDFQVNSPVTSSLNKFEIVNLLSSSYSSSTFMTSFVSGTLYNLQLSSSGLFSSRSILIVNTTNNQFEYYTSSFSSNISTYFSSSNNFNDYSISASVSEYPYVKLSYTESYYPVTNTSSLSDWNAYLNITASFLSTSLNSFYLGGGNLSNVTNIGDINNSISYVTLSDFDSSGLNSLTTLKAIASDLTNFPDASKLPNLTTLELYDNAITGSILSLNNLSSSFINTFTIGNNNISGSINDLLSILPQSISTVECSINNFTGSVPDLSSYLQLSSFDCSYNRLSGSIAPQTKQFSLNTLNCNNNYLNGYIPDLSSSYALQYFDCCCNNLSGSTPDLYPNYIMQSFKCSNNKMSGSISNISSSYLHPSELSYFDCSYNALTGNIPSMETYVTKMTVFNCSNNKLSGKIPSTYNTLMTTFICSNNQLTSYRGLDGDYPISTYMTYFDAQNNLLSQAAVDRILLEIDTYCALPSEGVGEVYLGGTGNSAPSAAGIVSKNSLIAKGWTVSTN